MNASDSEDQEPFPCNGYEHPALSVCQQRHPGVQLEVQARLQERGGSTESLRGPLARLQAPLLAPTLRCRAQVRVFPTYSQGKPLHKAKYHSTLTTEELCDNGQVNFSALMTYVWTMARIIHIQVLINVYLCTTSPFCGCTWTNRRAM